MLVDHPILTYLRFLQAINAKVRASGYDLMQLVERESTLGSS